jgi:hypothetical protein
MNHLITVGHTRRIQRQALPGDLIDYNEDPVCPILVSALMYEVIAPNMVPANRSEPNACCIVQPQPATFLLLLRYFQALLAPDPLHSLVIYPPALRAQQCRNPAIPVSAVLRGQLTNPYCQRLFIRQPLYPIFLGGSRLT